MAKLNETFIDLLFLEYQKAKKTKMLEWDRLFSYIVAVGNLELKEFEQLAPVIQMIKT